MSDPFFLSEDFDGSEEDEEESVYGFPMTTNPHEFIPDEEVCTPEELAQWKADCERFDKQEPVENPREGSGWYLDSDGNAVAHMLTTSWGMGVTIFTKNTEYPDFGPHRMNGGAE